MVLSIQQLSDESKLSHALRFEVLEQLCPPELVSDLLSRCHAWGERERNLNQLLVVYYVIALSLFRRLNLAAVLRHLVSGLRWLWSNPCLRLPTAAWCIAGGNWGRLCCATSSSAFADRWPRSKAKGPFASGYGS